MFVENSPAPLMNIVREHPLATLVIATDSGPMVCHIPLLIRESEGGVFLLEGHVSAVNPVATSHAVGSVLAIFHGPQHYVSPSWYPSKATRPAVPTWNYVAVHARGELSLIREQEWLRTHLAALSEVMERDLPQPWSLDDLPAPALQRAVDALVGIELRVTQLQGIRKLSQNKTPSDRLGVRRGLEAMGTPAALAMAARIEVSDVDEQE